VDERRTLEERWKRSAQALEERYKLELRNQHDKMAAAQQVLLKPDLDWILYNRLKKMFLHNILLSGGQTTLGTTESGKNKGLRDIIIYLSYYYFLIPHFFEDIQDVVQTLSS
jgi:hypothetical protein